MVSALPHESTWISTVSALPARGQPVEFMLAERECPIVGVYADDGFRSRWTHYAPELVCRWRGAATHEHAPALIGNGQAA
jgi:hypothetical protein